MIALAITFNAFAIACVAVSTVLSFRRIWAEQDAMRSRVGALEDEMLGERHARAMADQALAACLTTPDRRLPPTLVQHKDEGVTQ